MIELEKAYKIITSIPKGSSLEEYKRKAKEAFELCPCCVEATLLLNHFESDVDVRIDNLGRSIEAIEIALIEKRQDKLIDNLERAKSELVDEYIKTREYEEASYLLDTIDENLYDVKFRKMTLYAMLDDERIEDLYDRVSEKAIDHGYIYLALPYMAYLYKHGKKDQIKTYFDKMDDINPDIMNILAGIVNLQDEKSDQLRTAEEVLKNNDYLIDNTSGFKEYLLGLLNTSEKYA